MSAVPVWIYELVIAPAALGLGFLYARRAKGTARAAVEAAVLIGFGYALEWIAITVFASHEYGPAWRLAPGGVPLAVAAAWAAVILSVTRPGQGAEAALVALPLDLLMEPVAVRRGLWSWTPPGPWLGVPVGNFVGWGVIVGTYAWGAERWAGSRSVCAEAARRLAVAVASIASLLAVGGLWKRLGAERVFEDGAGWLVWAGLLALAIVFGRRLRAAPATLLLVAAPFLVDALLATDAVLGAAALGPLVALVWITRANRESVFPVARRTPNGTAS